MLTKLKQYLQAAADVVLPRTCPVCKRALVADERYVCRSCMNTLPRTHLHEIDFNVMEQRFAGKVRVEHAAAYFYYEKGNPYASIIHDIKYRNMPDMGKWLAARAASEMKGSEIFQNTDVIVPVPLHIDKLAQRGYNQAECIAQGIAQVTGATVCNAVVARKPHNTQTQKGAYERWQNTRDTYALNEKLIGELTGKNVLIVDDVVTTGATLLACAEAIAHIPGVKISLFTLAAARLD